MLPFVGQYDLQETKSYFDKCQPKTFLQVLFRGTRWLCQWAQLQLCEDNKERISRVCRVLEIAAMNFFVIFGWRSNFRIKFWVGHLWLLFLFLPELIYGGWGAFWCLGKILPLINFIMRIIDQLVGFLMVEPVHPDSSHRLRTSARIFLDLF